MCSSDLRATAAVEQAVDHGTKTYGDEFIVSVKQHPDKRDRDG